MMRVVAFLVLNAAAAVILSAFLMWRGDDDDDGGQEVGDFPDAPTLNGHGGGSPLGSAVLRELDRIEGTLASTPAGTAPKQPSIV